MPAADFHRRLSNPYERRPQERRRPIGNDDMGRGVTGP